MIVKDNNILHLAGVHDYMNDGEGAETITVANTMLMVVDVHSVTHGR